MIPDAGRLASNNLVRTYFELGMAAPGARELNGDGYRACIGTLNHPICNFATSLRLDIGAARRLFALASGRPTFHVYRLPTDEPASSSALLRSAGFDLGYRMTMMLATGTPDHRSGVELASPDFRSTVARFMADQFFLRHTPEFRRQIASVTASSPNLELFYRVEEGRLAAGIMLCRSEGVCGLYNLCVAPAYRSRGIGSSLVRWVLALAYECGEAVSLQCDARLESWYRTLGFDSCGNVEVFCLP